MFSTYYKMSLIKTTVALKINFSVAFTQTFEYQLEVLFVSFPPFSTIVSILKYFQNYFQSVIQLKFLFCLTKLVKILHSASLVSNKQWFQIFSPIFFPHHLCNSITKFVLFSSEYVEL
jgi:hypothetical protein